MEIDTLEEHLPISNIEWERIEHLHKCNFPGEDRTKESLKRKFQDLYRTKIPTGDPHIPPHIKRAKKIQQMREERINSSECEDSEDFDVVDESEDPKSNSEDANAEDSSTTMTSQPDMSTTTARPLGKVPFMMTARKRNFPNKSSEEDENFKGIQELIKLQILHKQEENERQMQEREEERRNQQRQDALLNRMMMTVLMATVPTAAPDVIAMIQDTGNNNHTTDSQMTENGAMDKEPK